jgi:hypothetical protein
MNKGARQSQTSQQAITSANAQRAGDEVPSKQKTRETSSAEGTLSERDGLATCVAMMEKAEGAKTRTWRQLVALT